jgi:adenosylcobinamide-phosphate synthase
MSLTLGFGMVLVALLLEGAAGYPQPLYRSVRHPVIWIGGLIDSLDLRLNHPNLTETRRRVHGALALCLVLFAAILPALLIQYALLRLLPLSIAILVLGVLAASLIAQRSLFTHVEAVADALEREGREGGAAAAAEIVGRDLERADEAAISRAAIESLAENFSDGVVAPAFWGALAGLPGIAGYKAINTADSMIGHLTPRHRDFGWAAARLDDLVNLPPARLSALFLAGAALFHRGTDAKQALLTAWQDARTHHSPNAGWPEAALAGALGLRLGGPRTYGGMQVNHGWIGSGRAALGSQDIRAALRLYRTACLVQIGFYGLLLSLILLM